MKQKFHAVHFPVGTVIELGDYFKNYTAVIGGVGVNANGYSFLELTELYQPSQIDDSVSASNSPERIGEFIKPERLTVGIRTAARIIKRGLGPVIVHDHRHNVRPSVDVDQADIRRYFPSFHFKKNFHYVPTLQTALLLSEAIRFMKFDQEIDFHALRSAIFRQSFVKKFEPRDYADCPFLIYEIDKKRLRRFIQRNINRFLVGSIEPRTDKLAKEHRAGIVKDILDN